MESRICCVGKQHPLLGWDCISYIIIYKYDTIYKYNIVYTAYKYNLCYIGCSRQDSPLRFPSLGRFYELRVVQRDL